MEEQSGGDAGDAGRAGHEPVRTLRSFGGGIVAEKIAEDS